MSQTTRLNSKFMVIDDLMGMVDTGVGKAEKIIKDAGGEIHQGVILLHNPKVTDDLRDAVDYLCTEWDYGYSGDNLW